MDRNNLNTYGYLDRGSYFGEIGILMNSLNQFDYVFYGGQDKPLQLLTIESGDFLEICNEFPISKEIFLQNAKKRLQMFQNYK